MKKRELQKRGKRTLAMILTAAMSMSGMTAYASITKDLSYHDGGEYDNYCNVRVVINEEGGEAWNEREQIVLPEGYVAESYSHTLSGETCGLEPTRWSLTESGKLPDGMRINRENGTIDGTPTRPGEYVFTVKLEAGDETASPSEPHRQRHEESQMEYIITVNNKRGGNESDTDDDSNSSSSETSGGTVTTKMGWILENGDWYYYIKESNGTAATYKGWHLDTQDGCWYYLDPVTGKMVTGWNTINGKEYYFAPDSPFWTWEKVGTDWRYKGIEGSRPKGSMYCNEMTPDGSFVGEDGAKIR